MGDVLFGGEQSRNTWAPLRGLDGSTNRSTSFFCRERRGRGERGVEGWGAGTATPAARNHPASLYSVIPSVLPSPSKVDPRTLIEAYLPESQLKVRLLVSQSQLASLKHHP